MAQLQNAFVPANYNPIQGSASLPLGRHPFRITDSAIKTNNDEQGGRLDFDVIITEGPGAGMTGTYRINLYHQNPKTVEIAHNQLSSLAYACGLGHSQITDTRQFDNMQFVGEVTNQKLNDAQAARAANGETVTPYTQISKVFYMDGREPGKEGQAPTQAPGPAHPMPPAPPVTTPYVPEQPAQQASQGWQQNAAPAQPQQAATAPPAAQGWQQNAAPAAPAAAAPAAAGWQQNAQPGAAKPQWGK